MNNSALEPVLFEKLHNIELSCSVFRFTTFFQFASTEAALQVLLQKMHDFEENLTILYSRLVTSNDLDHKFSLCRTCLNIFSPAQIMHR